MRSLPPEYVAHKWHAAMNGRSSAHLLVDPLLRLVLLAQSKSAFRRRAGRMIAMRSPATILILAMMALLSAVGLNGQKLGTPIELGKLSGPQMENACALEPELFALKKQDLAVYKVNGAVLFTAGMTIDADGAPNAYGPKNKGLDYTANARDARGWVALVTNTKGQPVIQRSGRYRGYYVSTTSLQQPNVRDPRNPKKYLDATRIPFIALPPDFARMYGISLGDLVVVTNSANGRSAYAVFGDVGPRGRIGEGSIALAKELEIPSNPRHDSALDGVTYVLFPGSSPRTWKSITRGRTRAFTAPLYRKWQAKKNCVVETAAR